MCSRLIQRLLVATLAAACLFSCIDKESGEPKTFLINNGRQSVSVSADAQRVDIPVLCDKKWTVETLPPKSWLRWTEVKEKAVNGWTVTLDVPQWDGTEARTAQLVFTAGSQKQTITVTQAAPDPFFQELRPGAYGVKGGDVVYNPLQHQYSRLLYNGTFSFRMLNLSIRSVVTLSGVPQNLNVGTEFNAYYRVSEGGITRVSESIAGVRVLRVQDGTVWLKAPGGQRFIVKW